MAPKESSEKHFHAANADMLKITVDSSAGVCELQAFSPKQVSEMLDPQENENGECAEAPQTVPVNDSDAVKEKFFEVNAIVQVVPRTWIGINKPGGAARILSRNDDNTYNVKYILDSSQEKGLQSVFMEATKELGKRSRRPVSDCQNADDGIKNAMKTTVAKRTKRRISSTTPHSHEKVGDAMTSVSSSSKRKVNTHSTVKNITIMSSGLDSDDTIVLDEFADTFNVRLLTRFDPNVTHLVVKVDENGMCHQRTMKYLQAIVAGIWVVSVEWVSHSVRDARLRSTKEPASASASAYEMAFPTSSTMTSGITPNSVGNSKWLQSPLHETRYEVRSNIKAHVGDSPRRARVSRQMNGSGKLFSEFYVLLNGQFPSPGPPRSQLEELLRLGGGTVTSSLDVFCGHVTKSLDSNDNGYGCDNLGKKPLLCQPSKLMRRTSSKSSGISTESASSISTLGGHQAHASAGECVPNFIVVCPDKDSEKEFLMHINAYRLQHDIDLTDVVTTVSLYWILDSVTDFSVESFYNRGEGEFYPV
jgi:hypothetical protein